MKNILLTSARNVLEQTGKNWKEHKCEIMTNIVSFRNVMVNAVLFRVIIKTNYYYTHTYKYYIVYYAHCSLKIFRIVNIFFNVI